LLLNDLSDNFEDRLLPVCDISSMNNLLHWLPVVGFAFVWTWTNLLKTVEPVDDVDRAEFVILANEIFMKQSINTQSAVVIFTTYHFLCISIPE
jgi:hypothetical protein